MEESMTGTEYLLREARSIATRVLGNPSEAAVLETFRELCLEIGACLPDPAENPA